MNAIKYFFLILFALLILASLALAFLGVRYFGWAPELVLIGCIGLVLFVPALVIICEAIKRH